MSIAYEFQNLECGEDTWLSSVFGFEADAEAAFAHLFDELPVAVTGYVARDESVRNPRPGTRGGGEKPHFAAGHDMRLTLELNG